MERERQTERERQRQRVYFNWGPQQIIWNTLFQENSFSFKNLFKTHTHTHTHTKQNKRQKNKTNKHFTTLCSSYIWNVSNQKVQIPNVLVATPSWSVHCSWWSRSAASLVLLQQGRVNSFRLCSWCFQCIQGLIMSICFFASSVRLDHLSRHPRIQWSRESTILLSRDLIFLSWFFFLSSSFS